ncbi:hypothetical protein LY474_15525 [Myxococcus stipitatus]|uniref:hypothetical protein n=1 Tax=Myxococcus stipitatus TaxID=83455 RepID=UPI001F15ACFF|nr:hypothetical protein [Myxococcus stipitatus]MCE9669221.1 hypothetical protein [Myxococcus stipitatus]
MRRSRATRGQSLVETALGLMVFVTILLFGIYFAEVGALTLKVQEAANFTLWNATGRVMHDPEAGEWQRPAAITAAAAEANERYADFDGRKRMDGEGVTIQLAIARSQPIGVDCETSLPAGVPDLTPAQAGTMLSGAMDVRSSGMRCSASARMRAERIGRFMEPRFFRESQREAAAAFTVCAAGRANGGRCPGQFAMLLDDWGLSTVAEGRSCPLSANSGAVCGNRDYYLWAERVYRSNGGGGNAGTALAALVGAESVNEDQFFMSFRGHEDQYEENIGATHAGGQSIWETTPFRARNLSRTYDVSRKDSWLGGVRTR